MRKDQLRQYRERSTDEHVVDDLRERLFHAA